MTSTTRFRSLIVILMKQQPQLHLISVSIEQSSLSNSCFTPSPGRQCAGGKRLCRFRQITKPVSVDAQQKYQKPFSFQMHLPDTVSQPSWVFRAFPNRLSRKNISTQGRECSEVIFYQLENFY